MSAVSRDCRNHQRRYFIGFYDKFEVYRLSFPEYLVSILITKFRRTKALLFFVLLSSFLLFLVFLYNLGSHCDKDGFNNRRKENSNRYILMRSKIYRRNFTRD